jgi:Lrp/AsnC family transcriptional regulator for asnA, asnC and gidA
MDKLDYLILAEIHKQGGISFTDIAKEVNSTPSTVRRRYKKMKKEGDISGCSTSFDLGRLGYQGKVFLLISLAPNTDKDETIRYLNKIENVFAVIKIIGPCDLVAISPIIDLTSIQKLIAETKKAPSIQKVEFFCINDVSFPIGSNFSTTLSQRCHTIAEGL